VIEEMRLNKYLARCGIGSRRDCDLIIDKGDIAINGEIVQLGQKVKVGEDVVTYRGEVVIPQKGDEYIAYHKPRGVIVTLKDTHGRETVYDALEKNGYSAKHLKYVGRLDLDSEGLLLLTNDGDLIHAITHPRFHIKKVYLVKVAYPLTDRNINTLVETGVESDDQLLKAGAIRHKEDVEDGVWYEVDLYEGKNRQIRRMFSAISHEVIRLKRTQFANIKLNDLEIGTYRPLLEREIGGLLSKGHKVNKKRG
jgi:23S rRNA pseudouridine2605 synthase